jgi:hypothetical protein
MYAALPSAFAGNANKCMGMLRKNLHILLFYLANDKLLNLIC